MGWGGVAWVGYGDGWGDVNVRVNLHAFCTLRRSRCLGWYGDGWGDVNVPWKRYVTYAGVGVGGEVAFPFEGALDYVQTPVSRASDSTSFLTQDSASLEPCGVRMKDMN